MGKPKNYISEGAAIETVKRWFADYPETDELTLEKVYSVAKRSEFDEVTNRNWLNNKMNQLKYHNLIKANQTFDSQSRRNKLTHIQLTMAGKRALGRIEDDISNFIGTDLGYVKTTPPTVPLYDLTRMLKAFRDSNPDFEVIFSVKFKGVEPIK